MSFQDNFNSASRYSPNAQKSKLQQFSPIFTGVLFLLVGVKYLSFSIKALGQGESFYFIVSLVIFASFITSFVLLRKGVALEKLYNASKYSHAPSLPLKTIAGGLLCTVSATSAYLGGYSFIASVTLGLAMFLGWYLYYGFDPREDKIEGYDSTQSAQRIMKLLIQANEDIELIKHSAKSCQSNSIQTAMHAMANAFEKIVLHIEAQPDDYERARKYLVSYLGELRSMSQTYIKLELQNKADEMEESFLSTLNSSVEKLDKQYEKLLDDDLMDLDIKLSVMKKRLENED